MSRAASRISRNRPSWSASINAHSAGQNVFAREAVGRFLQGGSQHKIYRRAHNFLSFACHLQQLRRRNARWLIERHQQVHVTAWPGVTARGRAEDFQAADGMLFRSEEHTSELQS